MTSFKTKELASKLSILKELDNDFLPQLCDLCFEFIFEEENEKKVSHISKKLQIEYESLSSLISSLSFLFISGVKLSLSPTDFDLYLLNFNLGQKSIYIISKKYQERHQTLKNILVKKNETTFGTEFIPHYKSLEWRLDVEVERRNIRKIMNPKFLMKLETSQDELLMSADYQDLKHCCSVLETALKEIKSNNVRRIKQYIK
eukprot:gene6156-10163_t